MTTRQFVLASVTNKNSEKFKSPNGGATTNGDTEIQQATIVEPENICCDSVDACPALLGTQRVKNEDCITLATSFTVQLLLCCRNKLAHYIKSLRLPPHFNFSFHPYECLLFNLYFHFILTLSVLLYNILSSMPPTFTQCWCFMSISCLLVLQQFYVIWLPKFHDYFLLTLSAIYGRCLYVLYNIFQSYLQQTKTVV